MAVRWHCPGCGTVVFGETDGLVAKPKRAVATLCAPCLTWWVGDRRDDIVTMRLFDRHARRVIAGASQQIAARTRAQLASGDVIVLPPDTEITYVQASESVAAGQMVAIGSDGLVRPVLTQGDANRLFGRGSELAAMTWQALGLSPIINRDRRE